MPNDHSLPLASRVPETALCGEDMDLLSKIHGDSISNDNVFLSVARMLYEPKMGPDDKMSIKFAQVRPGSGWPESQENRGIVEHFMTFTDADSIAIISLYGSEESNKPIFEAVTHLPEFSPGWEENKKLGLFLEGSKFRARVFTSTATKSVLVIGERIDTMRAHVLGAAASFLCPWYRDKEVDQPFCTERLFPSLLESQTPDAFLSLCREIQEERYDIRGARITRMLGDYETRAVKTTIESIQGSIRDLENDSASLNERLGRNSDAIRDYRARLLGYEQFLHDGKPGEIAEYFRANQNLELLDVGDRAIDFVARGYVDNYSAATENVLDNIDHTYIKTEYDNYNRSSMSFDDLVGLLEAVCLHNVIKMRWCARIYLNFPSGVNSDKSKHYPFGDKYNTYMPNIHLDQYGCFGDNRNEIASLARDGEYIGAIEQCLSATRSLDLSDSAVGSWFIRHLIGYDNGYYRNTRCFELPDGRVVGPEEAVAYLKEAA